MTANVLTALGGVGLFLIGMYMLSGGLRQLAGRRLHQALSRFTRTPASGALTGALTTALIQSSSATTVTAIGFVSAGLLTFSHALGIIFGANIGTTLTGWLVALLGFKLDLGQVVLPLVLVGALMQVLAKGNAAAAGRAVSGFALLFVGIDMMKDGMNAFQGIVTPSNFPGDDLWGRLQLVGIGIAITIVTQSSSAGVATALAALGAGAISFPQAAAMVIGMDVGTTFTAVLASVGGSTMARRTGVAHVVYNLMTGSMAFALLPVAATAHDALLPGDPQLALVGFHSVFNALGVLLVLPFTPRFAQLIEYLVPRSGPRLTDRLDSALLKETDVAVRAVAATVEDLCRALSLNIAHLLDPERSETAVCGDETFRQAMDETRTYLREVNTTAIPEDANDMFEAALHTLDHLGRLHYRCMRADRIATILSNPDLRRHAHEFADLARQMAVAEGAQFPEEEINAFRREMRAERKAWRLHVIDRAADGRLSYDLAEEQMDAQRWLHRSAYHLWRMALHLNELHLPDELRTPRSKAAETSG
ncbi:Na/Pi cotransporter family protein [Ruegeria marina]|uniref:Phosphate:Na+ symporter n=1 Tax=Ruegeria marina TaxID=639004 RepID=A0A1G6N2X4_9RHOB|nr:Na/Pi symporter [Ruegeria marina]SDC62208.1 phosphate:Na+ symporter [Ruegeria marina]